MAQEQDGPVWLPQTLLLTYPVCQVQQLLGAGCSLLTQPSLCLLLSFTPVPQAPRVTERCL